MGHTVPIKETKRSSALLLQQNCHPNKSKKNEIEYLDRLVPVDHRS